MSRSRKKVNGGGIACSSARAVRNWKRNESSRYRQLNRRAIRDIHDEDSALDCEVAVASPKKEASDPYGPQDGHGFRGTERQAQDAGWHDWYVKDMRK